MEAILSDPNLILEGGVPGLAVAFLWLQIKQLRKDNTREHNQGREERIQMQDSLQSSIDDVKTTSESNADKLDEIRERVVTLEVNQKWITQEVVNLPAFQNKK